MEHLGLIQRMISTAILGGMLGSMIAIGWWFVGRSRLRALAPAPRLRRLIVMASMPLLGAVALVGLVVLPSILHAAGWVADHCGAHPSHHAHMCLIHAGHVHANSVAWIAIGAGAMWFAWRARSVVRAWFRSVRAASALEEVSAPEEDGTSRLVASDAPFAVTIGLFAPQVLVSEALRNGLSDEQFEVVKAHEQVHADRRHALLQTGAGLLGFLHAPPVRAFLDGEIELACEQIADREAARRTGGPVEVADTILTIERLLRDAPSPASVRPSIDGSELERRILGLLEEPWTRSRRYGGLSGAVLAVAVIGGTYDAIHHGVETLFSVLF